MPNETDRLNSLTTLCGSFSSYKTRRIKGILVTEATFKDAQGEVICAWGNSEGFYLLEDEEYKVTGKIIMRHDNRTMINPEIEIIEKPAPAPMPAPYKSKTDWGGVIGLLFWGGIILWSVIAAFSSSSSNSTNNAVDASSNDSSYSSPLNDDTSDSGDYYSDNSSDEESYDSSDEYDDTDYDTSYDNYDYNGYTNSAGDYVPSPSYSAGEDIGGYSPSAICEDGTYSYSQSRSGTCSHHGGVSSWY